MVDRVEESRLLVNQDKVKDGNLSFEAGGCTIRRI